MLSLKPLVSVCCQVFNHEVFLEKTIKGFQSQITDFEIEIIICDDASTDNSKSIIDQFARLDKRIKPIFQNENRFSKNERILYKYIYPKCIGKYIAVCDGDDYWTDPLKLQKQVDFLESNTDYGIVGTKMLSYYVDSDKFIDWSHPKNKIEKSNIANLATGNFIFSSSVMLRNDFIIDDWWHKLPFCDWPLYLLQIKERKIKILNENMGVYRIHSNSMFSSKGRENQLVKEIDCIKTLLVYSELETKVKELLGNTLMKNIKILNKESLDKSNAVVSKLIEDNELVLNSNRLTIEYFKSKLERIKKSFIYRTLVKLELSFRRL